MAMYYDRDYGRNWNNDRGYQTWGPEDRAYGWNAGAYGTRYDRGYGAAGYDRGFKSRWETDYGDPFGDRTSRTPMRVIRGEYHGGYDTGFRGEGAGRNFYGYDRNYTLYDRDYGANPVSYDPYTGYGYGDREGTWMRGYDRTFMNDRTYMGRGRGYDTGWF